MALIRIPCSLREHCGGQSEISVDAADLGAALASLEARYPGCRDRIEDGSGRLREFVRLFLNDHEVELDREHPVRLQESDALSILPAVCGG
ncbi:MAG TPA: MoaD/ThiS family protein [Candidatus Dormibacteraeota bacterium]